MMRRLLPAFRVGGPAASDLYRSRRRHGKVKPCQTCLMPQHFNHQTGPTDGSTFFWKETCVRTCLGFSDCHKARSDPATPLEHVAR